MKNRQELAERLKGLPELYDQARKLFTYDKDEMLELGLITSKEKEILTGANHARATADFARREAGEAIPRPDITAELPQEYVELDRQKRELYEIYQMNDAMFHTLQYICTGMQIWSSDAVGQALGLQSTAKRVFEQFRNLPDPAREGYFAVTKQMGDKERKGSRVVKIRQEVFGDYGARVKEAETLAQSKTLREYRTLFESEKCLLNDISLRRIEKLQPIKAKIEALLDSI